jgi:hypothetical protein
LEGLSKARLFQGFRKDFSKPLQGSQEALTLTHLWKAFSYKACRRPLRSLLKAFEKPFEDLKREALERPRKA